MTHIPIVINIRKLPANLTEDNSTYIGRGSPYGNPYYMRGEYDRDKVIEQYEKWLRMVLALNTHPGHKMKRDLADLAGKKYLVCHCKPKACHGDVLVKVLREMGLT